MDELHCPGCGTKLPRPEGGGPARCPGCPGEYVQVNLTSGDFFDLLAAAEDGPEKDWYAERLAELVAEQVIAELEGGDG